MKKMISIILAGAVILSLSACKGSSKPSVSSQAETTTAATTKATTTTTTEETTTEETTTPSSSETEKSFDEMLPSDGSVFIDFTDKSSSEITENILNVIRLRTDTTADGFASRFSVKPVYKYSKGVWSFDWSKKVKPATNTFGKIEITAANVDKKIVLDKRSTIKIKFYIEDRDIGDLVYDKLCKEIILDGESADYLKSGLAINPKRSGRKISKLYRYVKYDYKWVEITVECDIPKFEED